MFMLCRASHKYSKQMYVTPLTSMTDGSLIAATILVVVIIIFQPFHSNLDSG